MEKKKIHSETRHLQRETAALQKAMQAAVTGQQPLTEKDLAEIAASQKEGRPLPPARARMVLLKVRVFLKTLQGLEKESRLLRARMEALSEDHPCPQNDEREDSGPGEHGLQKRGTGAHGLVDRGPDQHGLEDSGPDQHGLEDSGPDRHGLEDSGPDRHSLGISRALLLQLEAEAKTLTAAYRDLEQALSDAGRASDQADRIRLLQTTEKIRQQIRKGEI